MAAWARSHRRRSGLRSGLHPCNPRSHRWATACHLILGVLSTPRLAAAATLAAATVSGRNRAVQPSRPGQPAVSARWLLAWLAGGGAVSAPGPAATAFGPGQLPGGAGPGWVPGPGAAGGPGECGPRPPADAATTRSTHIAA